ncbi:hypothetical protein MPH_02898 [Macrophomina phaseolina MS6]|uniref:Uncharacterized protein n=1 Tax=Macrophomina phaseolina (strain MS6) TaxID=1126212 RepID=K2RYI1_MACPH|nr:hypothetical protein MPH_02898 [Macrophomina phaseolina MS6]
MVTAAETVFNCTELLELILSFAPVGDLLLVQRTCQRWKAVIEASTKLQRCLYFSPDRRGADAYGLNALLVQRFKFRRDECGNLIIATNNKWRHRLEACPTASWRRMLVSQPPEPFTLCVDTATCTRFGDNYTCGAACELLERSALPDGWLWMSLA